MRCILKLMVRTFYTAGRIFLLISEIEQHEIIFIIFTKVAKVYSVCLLVKARIQIKILQIKFKEDYL